MYDYICRVGDMLELLDKTGGRYCVGGVSRVGQTGLEGLHNLQVL